MSNPDKSSVSVISEVEPRPEDYERARQIFQTERDSVVKSMIQMLQQVGLESPQAMVAMTYLSERADSDDQLKREELQIEERKSVRNYQAVVFVASLTGVILLSYMFLVYGKPEYIVSIITALAGYAAGRGQTRSKPQK